MNPATSGSVLPLMRRPRFFAPFAFLLRNANKVPFVAIHLLVLTVILVPVTWLSLGLCLGLYVLRMFAITAGYHRYFSHRAYKTSRLFQFAMACLGCTSMQRGPLWWSANHRNHHKYSDMEEDPHSPVRHGLFWSHVGWVLLQPHDSTDLEIVKDFAKYPELRWLERLHWIPSLFMLFTLYLLDGWSGVVWGGVISTVLLYHGTFLVNSICHVFGRRRYNTSDDSRNNALVAVLTLGEGWHNNHHHYMSSANQGFKWWEIDMSYYALWSLSVVGIVWDLRKVPEEKLTPAAQSDLPSVA